MCNIHIDSVNSEYQEEPRAKNMKLGINIIRLSRKFTGVGRYIECLLNEWSQMELPFEEVVLYSHTPILQENVLFPLDAFTIKIVGKPMPDPFWEWRYLRHRTDVDLMFFPAYTIPFANRNKCVVTYHGPAENKLSSKEGLRSYFYDKLYRYSARNSAHVLVVSDAVKNRVLNEYNIDEKLTTTTLLAASPVFRKINDSELITTTRQQLVGSNSPFILFVGKLSRRHFIPELLEAFASIAHLSNHKLVIAGPDYLNFNIPQRAANLTLQDRIIYKPYIEHKELVNTYNAADIFIFPASDIEGFGLPVIEAMSCGTATISSNKGSIPEFASGATLLVDSNTSKSLANAMTELLSNEEKKVELGNKGLERAKSISWQHTAEKTMQVLFQAAKRLNK